MKLLKKHYIFALLGIGIIVLYFFTRLYHLALLPVFTDEAIYIRWSQIAGNDATWRFISLTDGKQPMFVWIAMILLKFIDDPLVAGRMVSVIAGFFSMIGMFFLGREVFKNIQIGLLASFLYVLYPFALVYDKLALYDSLVAMFIIWSLYFTFLLVRHIRLDIAMIFGIIIGGGMLTKTSANFGFLLLPFSLLLFPFKKNFDKTKLYKWVLFALTAIVIANAMYAVLRLSPFFHIVEEKNLTFIYSFHEWIQQPFTFFLGNMKGLSSWLIGYMTVPFFVLALSSFIVSKKFLREKLLLLIWFIVPFVGLAFFGKVIYPRFIFFMTIPLLLLGAYSLYMLQSYAKVRAIKVLLFVVFTGMFFVTDYFLLTDFAKAQIPQSDRNQFIASWPAGGGVKETVSYLEKQAQNEKIYVATEGTFGLMPYALEMYLYDNPNITIKGFWPVADTLPQELVDMSNKMPTYVVFYQPCPPCEGTGKAPIAWKLTEVFQLPKEESGVFYTLYKVTPQ